MSMRTVTRCLLVPALLIGVINPANAAGHDELDIGITSVGDTVTITATMLETVAGASGSVLGGVAGAWFGEAQPVPAAGGNVVVRRRRDPFDWCADHYRGVGWKDVCLGDFHGRPSTPDQAGDAGSVGDVPPMVVLHAAVASASVQGAGLVVEPSGWVFTGVPTLAHAQHQTLSTSVEVLGVNVPVVFTAQEYVFDFHTGQPPVRTVSPGAPYPDMSIQGTYQRPHPSAYVTLTTLWSATATHPVTGESLHIPGALRTEEHSAPFRVEKPRIRLISPDQYGQPQPH